MLGVHALKEMPDEIARETCRCMTLQTCNHGDVLLKEGTELFKFWIILSGEVTVTLCVFPHWMSS